MTSAAVIAAKAAQASTPTTGDTRAPVETRGSDLSIIGSPQPTIAGRTIDIMTLDELPMWFETTDRRLLIIGYAGQGGHNIDFTDHRLGPCRAIQIEPGQVHRRVAPYRMEGVVVVLDPGIGEPGIGEQGPVPNDEPPSATDLTASWDLVVSLIDDLSADGFRTDLRRRSVGSLLVHLVAERPAARPGLSPVKVDLVRSFVAALEANYTDSRSVSAYSSLIGTSTKTLARALAEVGAPGPKAMIDARVALQAKRLLVSTSEPAASVASDLGFTQPTNFAKFFQRATGETPQDFRDRHRQ